MPTVEELRKSFSSKSQEELLEIVRTPDEWSEEAVEAAKQFLIESGTEIPENIQIEQKRVNNNFDFITFLIAFLAGFCVFMVNKNLVSAVVGSFFVITIPVMILSIKYSRWNSIAIVVLTWILINIVLAATYPLVLRGGYDIGIYLIIMYLFYPIILLAIYRFKKTNSHAPNQSFNPDAASASQRPRQPL